MEKKLFKVSGLIYDIFKPSLIIQERHFKVVETFQRRSVGNIKRKSFRNLKICKP